MWSPAAVWGILVNCWRVVPPWPCPPLHNSIINGSPNGTPTANVAEHVVFQGKLLAAESSELSVRAWNRLCEFHLVNHGIHLPDRLSRESCWPRVYKLNRTSLDPHVPLSQVHALWSDGEGYAFILPTISCLEYELAYIVFKIPWWKYHCVQDRTALYTSRCPGFSTLSSQDFWMLTLGMQSLPLCLLLSTNLVLVNEVKKGGVGDVDRKHPAQPLALPCVRLCGSDQQFTGGQQLPAELNEHRWAVFQGHNQSKHSSWPTDTLINMALISHWGFRLKEKKTLRLQLWNCPLTFERNIRWPRLCWKAKVRFVQLMRVV